MSLFYHLCEKIKTPRLFWPRRFRIEILHCSRLFFAAVSADFLVFVNGVQSRKADEHVNDFGNARVHPAEELTDFPAGYSPHSPVESSDPDQGVGDQM